MKYIVLLVMSACVSPGVSPRAPLPSFSCPPPIIIVVDGQEWTERDRARLVDIQAGCVRRYGKHSCLSKLTKVRPDGYTATCKLVEEI